MWEGHWIPWEGSKLVSCYSVKSWLMVYKKSPVDHRLIENKMNLSPVASNYSTCQLVINVLIG